MKQYFIAICIVLLAMSCSDDSGKGSLPTPPAPPAEATLTLMIPGFRSASETRAGVHEEQINEIDVLLFRNVSGTERVAAMLTVPATSLHGTGTPGEARLTTSIPAGEYSRLALVVNAHTELTAAGITAGTSGSSYTDLRNVQTSGRYGYLGSGPDKTIPMYGEYAPAGGIKIEAGVPKVFPGTLPLIRSMARVDFVNQETSPDFVLSYVHFINVAGNGAVYVNPATYGVDAGAGSGGSAYLSPTLPISPALSLAPNSNNLNVIFSWEYNEHTYYLYEQPTSGPSALSYLGISRLRILLLARYKGQDTWYPIDFTWDGVKGGGAAPDYTKGTPMPILRNHRYIFTIKEVKGPGYATWKEAFTAPEMLTNQSSPLTIETHVIDEAYTDVAFNDQGFLAVSRTTMTLKGAHTIASTDNKVEVMTNVAGGFRVRSFNNYGTEVPVGGWLRPSMVSGAANSNQTVQAITSGLGKCKGYLEVRAGRLYTRVYVNQLWKLPLEYVAEYDLAGGAQYGTKPYIFVTTPAQTDEQLRWASNHDNDQSGYYNWYVFMGVTHPTFNPSGKKLFDDDFFKPGHPGYGYHRPSQWELTGLFPIRNCISFDNTYESRDNNEAIKFGGTQMTFSADYYSVQSIKCCYAVRFKAATGNAASSSYGYPKASDNTMRCAYRYQLVGCESWSNEGYLKVDCIYIGDNPSISLNNIMDRSWWDLHSAEIVSRTFPAIGYTEFENSTQKYHRYGLNISGSYWSSTNYSSFQTWFANFSIHGGASVSHTNFKGRGNSVRLFSSE